MSSDAATAVHEARKLGAVVDEADQLAEILGDLHDLAVLRAALDEHPEATTDQQAELRLYAEPAKGFVARVSALAIRSGRGR